MKHYLPAMAIAIIICLLPYSLASQTTLSIGDIALIGMDTDDEEFAFVTFVDLQIGTEIYFSDEEPAGNIVSGGEGRILYTASSPVNAGTVILFTSVGAGGFTSVKGNFTLANSGDGITVFQGYNTSTDEVTKFLHQIGKNLSYLGTPDGLENCDKVLLGSDNGIFNGARNASHTALYAAVSSASNYSTSNIPMAAFDITPFTMTAPISWNGTTWSNGNSPSSTDYVEILSDNNPGSFDAADLKIGAGFTLNTTSLNTININGHLLNSGNGVNGKGTLNFINSVGQILGENISGEFIVNISASATLTTNSRLSLTASSNSSYGMLSGSGTISGNINAQAWLNLTGGGNDGRYYYLGAPFTNAILSDFNEDEIMVSANTAQGTSWEWDAATANWSPAGNSDLNSTVVNGLGYALFAGTNPHGTFLRNGSGTITLSGTSPTTDVTVPIYYNNGQASQNFSMGSNETATEGWNLLANPYLAPYDWDGQILPANLSSAIYIWDGSNYTAYVQGAGSGNNLIAPFQAFWVQLTDNIPGNFTFDADLRNTSNTPSLSKKSAFTIDGINVIISDDSTSAKDELFIGFDEDATIDFDISKDAVKLLNAPEAPNLSVKINEDFYSVCRVPYKSIKSFPLHLDYTIENKPMTIQIIDDQLNTFSGVNLEDKTLGIIHDLGQPYHFQYMSGAKDRFILHFSENITSLNEANIIEPYTFIKDGFLVVSSGSLRNADLQLLNSKGQILHQQKNINTQTTLPVNLSAGVYFINLTTSHSQHMLKVIF